jgi:hypothetical protein
MKGACRTRGKDENAVLLGYSKGKRSLYMLSVLLLSEYRNLVKDYERGTCLQKSELQILVYTIFYIVITRS